MLVLLAVLLGSYGLLMVPWIEDAFAAAMYGNLQGTSLLLAGGILGARHFTYCMGDYLGCVKQEYAQDLVQIYKWKVGVGQMTVFSPSLVWHSQGVMPTFFSHAAYRSWTHDPEAGRPPDYFVASNKRDLPDGVLPDGEPDILLNFDTGSPEHTARRKLLADMLPALSQNPFAVILREPPGVRPSLVVENVAQSTLKRAVFDVIGYNLFLQLFGVDIADELAEHFEYDGVLALGVLGFPLMTSQGKRLAAIRRKILFKVAAGTTGKRFLAGARERGMDAAKRLSEIVWIAMFAGYGGTSNLAFEALKHILTDPARLARLFRKDPKAFMLEAARVRPPVGGMNPVAYRKPVKHVLANGIVLEKKPGDLALLLSSGANLDPAVFKDPANFLPGRANATKLLSWNNELDAFASCESVAGCASAPRGCPGTWLSLRLATAAVDFFVGGLEAESGTPGAAGGGEL